jgi:hypothetical protein
MAHSSRSFQHFQHSENPGRYCPLLGPDQAPNSQNTWPSEIQYKLTKTDMQMLLSAPKTSASYLTNAVKPEY